MVRSWWVNQNENRGGRNNAMVWSLVKAKGVQSVAPLVTVVPLAGRAPSFHTLEKAHLACSVRIVSKTLAEAMTS